MVLVPRETSTADEEAYPLLELADEEVHAAPPVVWIADDDPAMRDMLVEVFRRDGYQVVEFESGVELEDELERANYARDARGPELLIADVRMPGGDGLEAVTELRSLDWSTPVILMTAFPDDRIYDEARRLGVAAVFDKPFELRELEEVVAELLPPAERDEGDDVSS